jgi:hypothetical protein
MCHCRQILYFNHEDCQPIDCAFVNERHGLCQDCRHRRVDGDRLSCGLTRMALPAQGGCCHFNVELVSGPQLVTREMLTVLRISRYEAERAILEGEDIPYHTDDQGGLWVDPDELGLPHTYGLGTDHA